MILIVDDDKAIRSSLSFLLKRKGYDVECASCPQEAMEVVRNREPRLVIMDMNFTLSTTGDEGLTLLKQVKVFRPNVPVILITAWGTINLAVEGMKAGAVDFITKPWDNYLLMQRIGTILQLNSGSCSACGTAGMQGEKGNGSGEFDILQGGFHGYHSSR
ncbi:MAG: response regulator [Bacteroidales bacterium]|nr:response regulator [Bacteroidales bacterium]